MSHAHRIACAVLSLAAGAVACRTAPVLSYVPAELAPPRSERPRVALHVLKVRVWAEAQYRAQRVSWKSDFHAYLRRVNAYLEPRFGVTLEVEALREWEASGAMGDLSPILAQLAMQDPGEGVDWVIGLASGLPMFSSSLHQLGMARVFGKHMVLRGMDDPEELAALESINRPGLVDRTLPGPERAREVYHERLKHRELVIFLHELGHTLGAVHCNDPHYFMNPSWTSDQVDFEPKNITALEISLGHRVRMRAKKRSELEPSKELVEYLETTGWQGCDDADRLAIIATLKTEQLAGVARTEGEALKRARELSNDGKHAEAWTLVGPLAEARRDDPVIQAVACSIAAGREPASALEICARAAALSPADPSPALNLVYCRLRSGDLAGAGAALPDARGRLEARPDPDHWLYLAGLYREMGAVSRAEEAAREAGDGKEAEAIVRWARAARREYGLPPAGSRFAVSADAESDYVTKVKAISALVERRDHRGALREVDAALARYPNSPAILGEACAAHLGRMERERADAACRSALAANDEMPRIHLLAGVVAMLRGRKRDAIAHGTRAIAIDPDYRSAWVFVADQYRRSGEKARLEKLSADYQRRFDESLPLPSGTGR